MAKKTGSPSRKAETLPLLKGNTSPVRRWRKDGLPILRGRAKIIDFKERQKIKIPDPRII